MPAATLVRFVRRIGLFVFAAVALSFVSTTSRAADRPNILWLTCEDMSANLGCYGDQYAVSPTIDKLAAEGTRFTHCFTHIGVCAPSRSGLITGMYPSSIGSQHMRSTTVLSPEIKLYSQYLREAGYYCTNNSKTDYNFNAPKDAWDESSGKAHWKNRGKDQPFFAIFNFTVTHESQIRAPQKAYERNTERLTADQRRDPAKAPVPPYFPDTPIVRHDIAQYYENITAMDYLVADKLKELEEAGLADDTIVFFYSDHGAGLPRGKRWLYDSSLHVPLIVRWPEKWRNAATKSDGLKPGAVRDDLVAFVDLAPTLLSIAGIEIPSNMQGQAFLGAAQAEKPREYVYGARDRMDERVDFLRSVRDKQFKYIRNYEWWKPYAQNINYMNEMPTMREWRRLAAEGKLTGPQTFFMAPQKPREELYDCAADPHEVNNLAGDPAHAATLARLRAAHEAWIDETHDLGFLPEVSMQAFMRQGPRWRENTEMHNATHRIRALWQIQFDPEWAKMHDPGSIINDLLAVKASRDYGPGLTAIRIRCAEMLGGAWKDLPRANDMLLAATRNSELAVRIAAVQSLVELRRSADGTVAESSLQLARPIYTDGLKSDNPYVRHAAVLAVDALGPQAAEFIPAIKPMIEADKSYAARVGEFILSTRGGGSSTADAEQASDAKPKKAKRKAAK
jgi:uncharacterized sulfatase